MRPRPLAAAAAFAFFPLVSAFAGTLKGRLTSTSADANFEGYVIWIRDGDKLPPKSAEPKILSMNQVNKGFTPSVLAVRRGDGVMFENLDKVFHNVFSLDKRIAFDLGLFKGPKHFAADLKTEIHDRNPDFKTRRFDKEGKFQIFCNMHPNMMGTIYVFNHGYFTQADKDGVFELPTPASGSVQLGIDGPRLAAIKTVPVKLGGDSPMTIALDLAHGPIIAAHTRKDGEEYESEGGNYR